jgi:hypothetical protein
VWVNTFLARDLTAPFGGMRKSGMGRESGDFALDFYFDLKSLESSRRLTVTSGSVEAAVAAQRPWMDVLERLVAAPTVLGEEGAGRAVMAEAVADCSLLKLFTWLGQLGALGVLVLMTVTSFAVVAFFRRCPDPYAGPLRTSWRR